MGQKAEINGTGYDLKAGKCLVGGTAYAIKKGRTLKDGTGYDVKFAPKLYTVSIESLALTTFVTVGGVRKLENTITEAEEGTEVSLNGDMILSSFGVYINGEGVSPTSSHKYTFLLNSNLTISSDGRGSIEANFYVTTS